MKSLFLRLFFLLFCILFAFAPLTVGAVDTVVFVSDKGSDANAGTSASAPLKTLASAYSKLGGDGLVVVCGELTILPTSFPSSDACVTLTSVYAGVDYRMAGAQLSFGGNFDLRGDTVFQNIVFNQKGGNYIISCLGHNVTFGKGITSKKLGGADPTIVGGINITSNTTTYSGACFYDYTIRVESGQWSNVIGSNRRASSDLVIGETGNVRVVIDDGTFSATGGAKITDAGVIAVGGGASQNGDYSLEINGGRFACAVYGTAYVGGNITKTLAHYSGNVSITINGGYFNGVAVDAVQNQASSYVDGDYSLVITGGTFSANLKSLSAARVRGNAIQSVPAALSEKLVSFGKTVFLSENGNDANNGLTKDKPVKTVAAALKLLDDTRANVLVVLGKISVSSNTNVPTLAKTLTVTGCFGDVSDANAELALDGVFRLGGDTMIENIKISGGQSATLSANGHNLTIGTSVTSDGVNIDGGEGAEHAIRIASGDWGRVIAGSAENGTAGVFLSGGSVESLLGTESAKFDVYLEVCGGIVKNGIVGAEGPVLGSLGIVVTSGTVKCNIDATAKSGTVNGDFGLWLFGGSVGGVFSCNGVRGTSIAYHPNLDNSKFSDFSPLEKVVFVANGEKGSGESFLDPTSDLRQAVNLLSGGGTVVFCDDFQLNNTVVLPEYSDTLTLTSRFGGVDFRFARGASVRMACELSLGGETEIRDIHFVTIGENNIYCNAKKTVIGEGVECTADLDIVLTPEYPVIWGGYKIKEVVSGARKACDLLIASGTWGGIRLGNSRATENSDTLLVTTGTNRLTITGGNFKGTIALIGMNNHRGDISVDVTDGMFNCNILATYPPNAAQSGTAVLNGNVTLNLNGGIYCGTIAIAADKNLAKYKGTYTVNIGAKADLTRVSEISGTEGVNGDGTSVINVMGTNLAAELNTYVTFTNPIVDCGPDPSVYYYDGWYYYVRCRTFAKVWVLTLAKSANLCDIGAAAEKIIWRATAGDGDDLDSIWSPYINYIDGKWYIHGPCHVRGDASIRYPYYWVSKTDDPMEGFVFGGKMANYDKNVHSFLNTNPLSWGGKLYMFSSGCFRASDKSESHHWEKLFVAEAFDPTSFSTEMTLISTPTLSWEISYGGVVKIQEGGVPLLSPNGTLYLTYAANETLTDSYCTGLLRFKGTEKDSLANMSLWEKLPNPLHRYSYGETVFSPGAMVFTTDFEGNDIGVYHAKHFSAATYNGRATYIQTVRWVNDVPEMDSPTAGVEQTMKANPMPIGKRISGFTIVTNNNADFDPSAVTTAPITTEPTVDPDESKLSGIHPLLFVSAFAGILAFSVCAVIIIKKKKK